jgi:hypothetical protein
MKTEAGKTVYEISTDDLQEVAKEVFERELTEDELTAVGIVSVITSTGFKLLKTRSTTAFVEGIKRANHNPFAST